MQEAVRHYTEALRLNPHYAQAHNNLGNALMDGGKAEEAIRHYTEALRLNPNAALFHNNLGVPGEPGQSGGGDTPLY